MAAVLVTQGLRKRYGQVQALQGVDLEVQRGEVFGFLGPNGAGKTTFTKCVTGFVRPDGGRVEVLGIDALRHPTRVAHHVGLVPDQYDFYSNLTGRQHLEFYGRLLGMGRRERRQRIEEVLALVRMDERSDSRVKTYSHGMKQRICIAQAMLHRPGLVIFDEPTNGLDPKGAYELRQMIRGLAKDGTTVFLNSHVLNEVQETCQRVAILDKGRVLRVGRVDDLRREAGGGVRIRLLRPSKVHLDAASAVAGDGVRLLGDTLVCPVGEERTPDLVAALVRAGARIFSVSPDLASLESVFLELTSEGNA
ncbi:MAG TPA: ABC transporter ATP-binding protein [Candidatus Thermoplasmatota archaeon]|nr:ABC transporter ATP-binding protein [Candidatus Thermoplasmatota archaeon]